MIIIKLKDALGSRRKEVISAIKEGKVIVYPTDTIYGIGCNAENATSVEKIRNLKGKDRDKPFSVIAPSFEWVENNATATGENLSFARSLLPGPYTVIMKAKPSAPKSVVSGKKTIGIRIPASDFTSIVTEAGVPFVTTSVNLTGEEPIRRISEIPEKMKSGIDIAIDAGEIDELASRIFDITGKDVKIVRY
ncbi:MAG: threonylcarbamoyl-AMP synthase [Candidatus Micrarchaeota archaeon]|nr:threonylcarbamoyl-AMP synthase [Candidatus Micrarchaeota archaeon]